MTTGKVLLVVGRDRDAANLGALLLVDVEAAAEDEAVVGRGLGASLSAAISSPTVRLDPEVMLKEALANEETVVALMHEGIDMATAAGDPGTADLLTRFVQSHQKEAWFLREMLG